MKQGWEIKKLGEVCNVINGLWVGKKEPFINIAVIRNTNFSKDCQLQLDNVAFIDVEVKQFSTRKLLQGDIIIEKSGGSDKQPVGRVVLFNIIDGNYSFSNFTSVLRIKSTVPLIPNFLHKCLYEYYIKGETIKLQSKTTGLRNLNMHAYLRLNIPVPPLSEQERIVEELDLLSDVIAKKREQLKQLDTLAQSIFYDMFGDPITNEKGWKQVSLVDICKNTGVYGAGSSSMPKQLYRPRYVRITDILDSGDLNDDFVVSSNVEDDETYRLNVGDILFARSGATVGKTYLYRGNEAQIYAGYLIKFSLNILYVNPIFIFYITKNRSYKLWISKQIIGVAQPNINAQKYGKLPIILPPLALQQQFASMIESIEKQKELIKQSLSEVQQLFDSRMDYYFG